VKPRILLATLDGDSLVAVRFHRRVRVDCWTRERFSVANEAGQATEVAAVQPVRPRRGKAARYLLTLAEPVDLRSHAWKVSLCDVGDTPLRMGRALDDAARFCESELDLGARWTVDRTTFRVFAPTAAGVQVVVADELEDDRGLTAHEMIRRASGIWEIELAGNLEGRYYAYRLSGPGFDPQRELTDIYATCTQGPRPRSLILDLSKTDPPGFRDHPLPQLASPTDAVIYEMHVRDFTIAANSGATARGKYLGLAEAGTHLPGDPSVCTGLDHLCELGITHVQLMPVQDFDNRESDDDWYNWGYMPAHYNSPDGWYATSRESSARIIELKQAIQAFHSRGIGVILDVVYNHTSSRATFEQLVPDYYFRRTCRGSFANGSGCGNEFRTESPMGRKFLLDSLKYWVREYRVDGFRFDIMALTDLPTLQRIKAELEELRPGILLYGEPWTAGPTPLRPLSDQRHLRGTGIGAFNECLRDAIKGSVNGPWPGYVQTGERVHDIRHGLEGFAHLWHGEPAESVNYFECHDNLTAWDKLLLSMPDTPEETLKRMMRFAALLLFTSQGITFMHSGQEFCRSKNGSHNSYDQPDDVNQIDWSLKKANADVCVYHRGMIAIRRSHPVLRLRTRQDVDHRVSFMKSPHPKCVVCHLDGTGLQGEQARHLLILLNGHHEPVGLRLPPGRWSILADAMRASTDPLGTAGECATLPPHSGMLLSL
jgi:pullulanase